MVATLLAAGVVSSLFRIDENNEVERIRPDDIAPSPVWADRTSIRDAARAMANLIASEVHGAAAEAEPEQGGALPVALNDEISAAVYVFGEPALLFHLHEAGITAIPVNHLKLQPREGSDEVIAFVIIGPHAKRTDGFWHEWVSREASFDWVGEVTYQPSRASLLDLFSPDWLRTHPESQSQLFELHRVR